MWKDCSQKMVYLENVLEEGIGVYREDKGHSILRLEFYRAVKSVKNGRVDKDRWNPIRDTTVN